MNRNSLALPCLAVACLAGFLFAPLSHAAGTATLVSKANRVDVAQGGGGWSAGNSGQSLGVGDRVRTGEDSRATVQMGDGSVLQLDELTTVEIKAPKVAGSTATLNLPRGAAYFFNKGNSPEVNIETPSANGAIRGTAFVLTVDNGTTVSMIEGAFELSSAAGKVTAREREQARTGAGNSPAKGALSDRGDSAPWYLVLENDLARPQALGSAGRAEFFNALPEATTKWRQIAPNLAGAATLAKKPWAKEILQASFAAVGGDCGMRARILQSVTAAAPEQASELLEFAMSISPECGPAFGGGGGAGESPSDEGNFDNPPGNINPPPGSIGGGGAQGNLVAICHNGRVIFVSPRAVAAHVAHGDTIGSCQVTPVTNP